MSGLAFEVKIEALPCSHLKLERMIVSAVKFYHLVQ